MPCDVAESPVGQLPEARGGEGLLRGAGIVTGLVGADTGDGEAVGGVGLVAGDVGEQVPPTQAVADWLQKVPTPQLCR